MRMFTAVIPPPPVVEAMEEFLEPRRDAGGPPLPGARHAARARTPLRWVRPEAWHLTLGFMPEVSDRVLDDLVERLVRAGRRRRPVELRLAGGGAFPGAADARVLYGRVQAQPADTEELRRLATGARAAAGRAGVRVQGGRFTPHVTLARLRRPDDVARWLEVLDTFASPSWHVTEFALISSELGQGPRGTPRYRVEERFTLRP